MQLQTGLLPLMLEQHLVGGTRPPLPQLLQPLLGVLLGAALVHVLLPVARHLLPHQLLVQLVLLLLRQVQVRDGAARRRGGRFGLEGNRFIILV